MRHIYGVIIGSEILDARRVDKHFEFLQKSLQDINETLYGSFIIKDDPLLIKNIYNLIKSDPHSIMFSFGGIGSTPDDYTRLCASEVFDDGKLYPHPKFSNDIIERFGDEAYPNRIKMAHLPKNSALLYNVINNMSGFYLDDRYFFMPGFPQMSHPMVSEAIERFIPANKKLYRNSLLAHTSEDRLIHIMTELDDTIELSSLPIISSEGARVEISVASTDERASKEAITLFVEFLQSSGIYFHFI